MMRAPRQTAVYAAELRVAQSRFDTLTGLRRASGAFRAALIRPSTLALIVAAGGLLGFWLVRGRRPQAPYASGPVAVAATTSVAGLVMAFVLRYAAQNIPLILQRVWVAAQKRSSRVDPNRSKLSATYNSATGVVH